MQGFVEHFVKLESCVYTTLEGFDLYFGLGIHFDPFQMQHISNHGKDNFDFQFPFPLQYFLLGLPFDHTAPGHPFGKLGFAFFEIESGNLEQSETKRNFFKLLVDS